MTQAALDGFRLRLKVADYLSFFVLDGGGNFGQLVLGLGFLPEFCGQGPCLVGFVGRDAAVGNSFVSIGDDF